MRDVSSLRFSGEQLDSEGGTRRRGTRRGATRIPILMYHGIAPAAATPTVRGLHMSPQVFHAQMQYLRRYGYRTLALGQALDLLHAGHLPDKVVVLTFDDGYENFYREAFPILMHFGFVATVFVIAGFAGRRSTPSHPHAYMSLQQMREVLKAGIQIGSHTLTHPELQRSPRDRIDVELQHSRQFLEEGLGTAVEFFAYPYAFPERDTVFRAYLRQRLSHFGYRGAVSTLIGRACATHDPYLLPRLPIHAGDAGWRFAAKLRGVYDWMRLAQSIRKRVQDKPHQHWQGADAAPSEA